MIALVPPTKSGNTLVTINQLSLWDNINIQTLHNNINQNIQ